MHPYNKKRALVELLLTPDNKNLWKKENTRQQEDGYEQDISNTVILCVNPDNSWKSM